MKELLKELDLQQKFLPINGGDINQAFRVTDGQSDYFLKVHPQMDESFFAAEVDGLKALGEVVRVPKVHQVGKYGEQAYLLLEWITPGAGDPKDLARELSKLHQKKAVTFGYPRANFMGILPQKNHESQNWPDFYFTERLEVQIELAKARNRWQPEREKNYQRLKAQTLKVWQAETFTPSLLHGDFWSGNTFYDENGAPVFVDPAVSYGDREVDLAMAQLFGGFRREFFTAYQEFLPLKTGWQARLPIYQLYYLLVHLNIFGESYGGAVDRILTGGN